MDDGAPETREETGATAPPTRTEGLERYRAAVVLVQAFTTIGGVDALIRYMCSVQHTVASSMAQGAEILGSDEEHESSAPTGIIYTDKPCNEPLLGI